MYKMFVRQTDKSILSSSRYLMGCVLGLLLFSSGLFAQRSSPTIPSMGATELHLSLMMPVLASDTPPPPDSSKSRIDKDGKGRWTNIEIPDTVIRIDHLIDSLLNAPPPEEDESTVEDERPSKTEREKEDVARFGPSRNSRKIKTPDSDVIVEGEDPEEGDGTESVVRRRDKLEFDTTLTKRQRKLALLAPPDPNVALRRSLLLPGWGQIYNRSAWKVPIIYAGFGGLGVMFVYNHREYRYHKLAAICISDESCTDYPEFAGFSQENVISTREFHRRYRDLSVIIGAPWYALNGIDAYVEAHLQPFEVGDDLSLRVKPAVLPDPFQQRNVYLGASISLGFRK